MRGAHGEQSSGREAGLQRGGSSDSNDRRQDGKFKANSTIRGGDQDRASLKVIKAEGAATRIDDEYKVTAAAAKTTINRRRVHPRSAAAEEQRHQQDQFGGSGVVTRALAERGF